MGEVLFELDQVLRSKQHKLTLQEANALLNCKSKALKDYAVGSIFGAGISWIATSKLSLFGRISVSAGASAFAGLWRLGSSLDSCLDHILALEGSKMQKELATILVTKYRDDPWRMRQMSKHFYSERVFDDTTSDQPKLRWRYRISLVTRSFVVKVQMRPTLVVTPKVIMAATLIVITTVIPTVVPVVHALMPARTLKVESLILSPSKLLNGGDSSPNPSTTSPRTHTRSHKRAHRRRRMRQQDVGLNPQPL